MKSKLLIRYITILSLLCLTQGVQAEPWLAAAVPAKKEVKCEYLRVQAPTGWIIQKLTLTMTEQSRKNHIVEGGEQRNYVILHDGIMEGASATISFIPEKSRQKLYPSAQYRLTVQVQKNNCYMGDARGKVSSQLGESFMPSKLSIQVKDAVPGFCKKVQGCKKDKSKMGKISYEFEPIAT